MPNSSQTIFLPSNRPFGLKNGNLQSQSCQYFITCELIKSQRSQHDKSSLQSGKKLSFDYYFCQSLLRKSKMGANKTTNSFHGRSPYATVSSIGNRSCRWKIYSCSHD